MLLVRCVPVLPPSLRLTASIEQLLNKRTSAELAREGTFSDTYAASEPDFIDLSSLMEVSVLELRIEVPLELVVNTIQKMVRASFPFYPPPLNGPCRTCDKFFSLNEGNLWV